MLQLDLSWRRPDKELMKTHGFFNTRCLSMVTMIGSAGMVVCASPFDSAKITRVENKVTVGEIHAGQASARRPAVVSDAVKASNFVQTGTESRTELQFQDTSLVRVGQNSIFSFEAKSRTLSLQKGDMLFYVAPGQGKGTIKTPALTAGITGTLCKVAPDMIAVLRGSITVTVDGKLVKVPAGWAVMVVNRKARIYKFDQEEANRGKLYSMGPLPEDPGIQIKQARTAFHFPGLHDANAIDSGVVNPSVRQATQVQRPGITQPMTPTLTQTQQPAAANPVPVPVNPNGFAAGQ